VDEAVAIANDSDYGLHAAVFSADSTRALGIARRIRSGPCSINQYKTNFFVPYGGMKASGRAQVRARRARRLPGDEVDQPLAALWRSREQHDDKG
jgi:acyl-CoA reductase-like NAD-dependent aldehyde dehydrogenase